MFIRVYEYFRELYEEDRATSRKRGTKSTWVSKRNGEENIPTKDSECARERQCKRCMIVTGEGAGGGGETVAPLSGWFGASFGGKRRQKGGKRTEREEEEGTSL